VPAGEVLPVRLQRFVEEEWEAYVGPEPAWWSESGGGMSWSRFKARLLWGRARSYWAAARGLRWWGRTEEGRAQAVADLARLGITFPGDEPSPSMRGGKEAR